VNTLDAKPPVSFSPPARAQVECADVVRATGHLAADRNDMVRPATLVTLHPSIFPDGPLP
jgi:hypothetical protein